MEKPYKYEPDIINTSLVYVAEEMDAYLAQKDKEIMELVEFAESIENDDGRIPKEIWDGLHSALNKHKTINE